MARCSAPSAASILALHAVELAAPRARWPPPGGPAPASTSSAATLRRGVRTLRRSTVQQRPTAMPGEAGEPLERGRGHGQRSPKPGLEDLGQRRQRRLGVLALADHHHRGALPGRQREHAHDALGVDLQAVLLELDVAAEAVGGLHDHRGGARVQPERVDDGEGLLEPLHVLSSSPEDLRRRTRPPYPAAITA